MESVFVWSVVLLFFVSSVGSRTEETGIARD